ncbi:MAG: UDP-N-acetylmuramoyl-tripeptide--D-alanyl-D-alanine ligase [Spirochaetota bacterium]
MVDTVNKIFSPEEFVKAASGETVGIGNFDYNTLVVSIDSRKCTPGCLFVALKGEKTDGHFYIESALKRGARNCLLSRSFWLHHKTELLNFQKLYNNGFVVVDEPLRALQSAASAYMLKLDSVLRIGVTGSSGKTTVKELIGSIFSRNQRTAVNEGNLNSEIGLSLAVFGVQDTHKYAVFEMGMNRIGEMEILSQIVRPDYAVITNIGSAHVGLLGSCDSIALEKKKVFSFFDGGQKGFIYEKEKYFEFLAAGVKGEIVPFGPESLPGYSGSESLGLGGTLIRWEGIEIHFPLIGGYNLINALGAITVALHAGIDAQTIKAGLESAKPLFGRNEIIKGPVTIIQDCYNANPDSMAKALDFFDSLHWPGRKILILGSMMELGDFSKEAHRSLGERVLKSSADAVFLMGEEAGQIFKLIGQGQFKGYCYWSENFQALAEKAVDFTSPGDLVLVKGSRALELERITEVLKERNR